MTLYTVQLAIEAREPLTQQQLFDVAVIGGDAAGTPSKRPIETWPRPSADPCIISISTASTDRIVKVREYAAVPLPAHAASAGLQAAAAEAFLTSQISA
jgi:hypothetical protein